MNDNKTNTEDQKKKKPFWQRHFLSLFLTALLILSITWGFLNNKITENRYKNTITEINVAHKKQLDSINVNNIKELSNTLALAVRSEMMAENRQQIDHYFIQTVKMFNVRRILLVDPSNGKVLLSTDKKDNDSVFKDQQLVKAQKATTKKIKENQYVATPIMGLNTQLGTLIIQIN